MGAQASNARPSVIMFMANLPLQELYRMWMRSHLAERIGWNFAAESPEAFEDITSNSAGQWSVLLTDSAAEASYGDALQRFAAANSGVTIIVLTERGAPSSTVLRRARVLPYPQDIDNFLAMMHGLL